MDVLNGLDLRARRITSLADPTGAQDAATKAYVDAHSGGGGGAGWTQLGATVATTSGTTASFGPIPATYSDLALIFEGLSHNNASTTTFTIELSDNNGVNWTPATTLTAGTTANSEVLYGRLDVPGYRFPCGAIGAYLTNLTADRTVAVATRALPWRIAAGINAIRIGVLAGAFDAGTIKLLARA
ncbi:MAG: hypothetical protein JWQ16_2775 [Novosphingobium sp.]|nr:hypothetical protein [Novosphingobium sp.]